MEDDTGDVRLGTTKEIMNGMVIVGTVIFIFYLILSGVILGIESLIKY